MIDGAHAIIYSKNADADRRFLLETLRFPHVDAGHGWLIFALPPAELAVHPAEENGRHELYLMCSDIDTLTRALRARGVECSPLETQRWGILSQLTLPGGGTLGIYEPRHARPPTAKPARRRRPTPRRKPALQRKRRHAKKSVRRK
jgi:hypothetical protein